MKTLSDLIREATPEDKAALREALVAAPAPTGPARQVLDPAALRTLRARHEAATKRVTEERAKLGREMQAATETATRAQAEMARLANAQASLDWAASAELDEVRAAAFAGRPVEVDEAAAALRLEAVELEPDTAPGAARFPGGPPELFSNRETVEARRRALHELADLVILRSSQATFATAADVAAFVAGARKTFPAVEAARDVRRRIEAARERGSAAA